MGQMTNSSDMGKVLCVINRKRLKKLEVRVEPI